MQIARLLLLLPLLLLGCATHNQNVSLNERAYDHVYANPSLPRVLLIGDSISIGYTHPVREMLRGKANVYRIPENGGPTTRGLEKYDEWLTCGCFDVIHFNWGLHDLKYMEDGEHQVSIDQYERNLAVLVQRLLQTDAKLIWASTTPVPQGDLSPKRVPGDVLQYNAVAKEIMDRRGVMINDLYTFAFDQLDQIQRPANVHFTDDGSYALGAQVAESILQALDE
ncbi:MAG: SGNH/GDSL hydrolase family protein [Candidatus Hinthialibacter antarcticus]|nr:SGNH/GDSL hydrolase family protein [Candidatus Hinthialibacter antarcticus]